MNFESKPAGVLPVDLEVCIGSQVMYSNLLCNGGNNMNHEFILVFLALGWVGYGLDGWIAK